MYGERILSVMSSEFNKWALRTRWRVRSKRIPPSQTGLPYNNWIFPAEFCTMRFINDPRYMPDEPGRPSSEELAANPHLYRSANVEFRSTAKPKTAQDYRKHSLVQVVALRNIRPGEELFVDYGNKYAGLPQSTKSRTASVYPKPNTKGKIIKKVKTLT